MKNRTSAQSFAPMAELKSVESAIAHCQTPEQVEDLKAWIVSLQSLFKKRGLFEKGFKASELWIEADRKLKDLIGRPGVTDQDLAEAFLTSEDAIKILRADLNRAYDKPDEMIDSLKHKAFKSKEYLTRKWFIKGEQESVFR